MSLRPPVATAVPRRANDDHHEHEHLQDSKRTRNVSAALDDLRDRGQKTLAESRIRLPDGRTDTRYVRTCPDQYGRYRVVD